MPRLPLRDEKFHTYLIMGPHVYGVGEDLIEAKANFKRHGGNRNRAHVIYRFGEGVRYDYVDDMGGVHYHWDDPSNKVEPVKTKHRVPKE